jgi:hypothetical protein
MQMNFSERFNEFWRISRKWRCRWFFSIGSRGSRGSKNVSPPMESVLNDPKTKIAGENIFTRTLSKFSPLGGTLCTLRYITSNMFEWVQLISNHFH